MVEDTRKRDAFAHVAGAAIAGPEKYLTNMEADGTRQLVASDLLPSDGPWVDLAPLGFTLGDVDEADPMFRRVALPQGWSRAAADDDDRVSYVLDPRGVRRLRIFYKAVPYDRKADFQICRVGRDAVSDAVYSDGEPSLPVLWAVFNDKERAEYVDAAKGQIARAAESPSPHANERARRARKLLELIESTGHA